MPPTPLYKNYAEYHRQIQMVYGAFWLGASMFLALGYWLHLQSNISANTIPVWMFWLLLVANTGAVIFFSKYLQEKASRESGLYNKLIRYQTFLIIRLALLEFIVLFAAVLVMQGAGMAVLAVALLVLLGMLLLRPTPEKVASEWGLSEK